MPIEQRRPFTGRLDLRLSPRPVAGRRPKGPGVLAVSLASMLAAAALWASADGAAAMASRGSSGYLVPAQGNAIASRVGISRTGTATWRRWRVVRLPSGDGRNPPRHPGWPHRPRWPHPPIIGVTPLPPAGPIGLANLPPSGPTATAGGSPNGGGAGIDVPAANERRFVSDEILVRFAARVPPRTIVSFAQGQRLALLGIHRLPLINTVLYQFRITDRRAVPAVLDGVRGDARIGAAQPNYLYALQDAVRSAATGDPAQYVVGKLHLAEAHAFADGGHALVAVIDSAIDAMHPELQDVVAGRFDAIGGTPLPHQHGTAMASAIAAHGRLLGVAPATHILAVRAFDGNNASAQSTTTRVLDSLQWVANSGARVVNMSFAGPADPKLHEMIASVRQKGLVPVAAAGNDGPQAPPDYPAAYPEVIAVTATDADDKLLSVANHGSYVSVAAPGVDIFVATPNGRYGFTTGTSVATAHVSGLAALLIDRDPSLTPDAVQAILMRTAKDLGPKGRDDEYGAGLVDAYEALLAIAPATAARTAAH